ncbi:MAG: c-type cytochrome biogenesis protein CcmI [Halioglobus sp.]|nr:c-type cytochrome biogenesis protein CcmI [Halioglobus sp.]
MTVLIVVCGALVLLSGLFFLFPSRRAAGGTDADEDLARANLEWFRLREAELAREGSEDLREDARLRLLEDDQQGPAPAAPAAPARPFPVWILLPLVALLSAAMYYRLGAAPDVVITRQLQSLDESSTPEDMAQLIEAIAARAAQRPDNLHYTALLARYYMQQQDYQRAAGFYTSLAEQVPEDAQALAWAAQARFLAAGRTLSDSARLQAEQALAIDPHQRTALGLLGMVSFEQGQYRAAIDYWQRLLATEAEDSEAARMISGVIASARKQLGAATPGAATPPGPGVTVRVSLPGDARVNATDTVFILARSAASDSRMPIAVQRLRASQLPLTLRLDDSNSMAGQKLSATDAVVVVVQVSPDGRPGEAFATWLGRAGPLAPSLDAEPLEIVLQPRQG